jgi:uncharacterized protein
MDWLGSPWFLVAAGLFAGSVMGFVARHQHFCTMSALERHWYADDSTGLRTWVLAAAVALISTQVLQAMQQVDALSSFYVRSELALVGAVGGGVAFGVGMALVGTCGFGALVRMGGGSLRSFVVLIVLALSALAAQKGLIAQLRVIVSDNHAYDLSPIGGQSLGLIASHLTGRDITLATAIVLTGALALWIFRDAGFRQQKGSMIAGVTMGLVITFGWWATTLSLRNSFDVIQLESGSFVVPVADTVMQAITFTGVFPDYGVGLVVGVGIGAAACAYWKRDIRWEACDDARELGRHLLGGFLMGTGGVFAMGCTIGQGVSAVSTMAISAPIVMLSVAVGAKLGLSYLLEGSPFSAFRNHPAEPAE